MKSVFSGSGIDGLLRAVGKVEKRLFSRGASARVLRVVAVDPGTVTGVCVLWVWRKSGRIAAWGETLLAHNEHTQVAHLLWLLRKVSNAGDTDLVVESFRVLRVSMENSFLSPDRIGRALEWGAVERGAVAGAAKQMQGGALRTPVPELIGVRGGGPAPFFGAVRVWWHSSSEMTAMSDARLKKLGFYTPGPDHRRDATRHGLLHWKDLRSGKVPGLRNGKLNKEWDPQGIYGNGKLSLTSGK